jgi:hypothetical protein
MKGTQAARLVDKNSRCIVKILQLQQVCERATSRKDTNSTAVLESRIEKLQNRLNRRLIRLSKWGDNPNLGKQISFIRTLSIISRTK